MYDVDIVDRNPNRQELALRFGARCAVGDIEELDNFSYTVAFDCFGDHSSFSRLQKLMMQFGKVCIISDPSHGSHHELSSAFFENELSVLFSSDAPNTRAWRGEFVSQLTSVRLHSLSAMFRKEISFRDLVVCFTKLITFPPPPPKVLVRY